MEEKGRKPCRTEEVKLHQSWQNPGQHFGELGRRDGPSKLSKLGCKDQACPLVYSHWKLPWEMGMTLGKVLLFNVKTSRCRNGVKLQYDDAT